MIQVALDAFKLMSLSWRVGIIAAFFGSILVAGGIVYHGIWERGHEAALVEVAKADAKTIARATAFRNKLLECRSQGRDWDQSTGRCLGE
jgi:hypothetical protein